MANGENKSGRPSKSGSKAFTEIFRKLIGEATQQEAADKIGVTRQNVGRWLAGMNTPDIEALEKIADAYEVSTDYLLGRTTVKTPNVDLRAICEYTQLSETTVRHLHKISPSKYRFPSEADNAEFFEVEIAALNTFIDTAISIRLFYQMANYVDDFIFTQEFNRCALKKYCSEYNVKATETEINELSEEALLNDPDRFPGARDRGVFDFELYKRGQILKYGFLTSRTEILQNGNDYANFLLEKKYKSLFEEALDIFLEEVFENAFYLKREKNYREYFDEILSLTEEEYSDHIKKSMDFKVKFEKAIEFYKQEQNKNVPKGEESENGYDNSSQE